MNTPATTPIRDVKTLLRSEAAQEQLAKVAAQHMRPEKMMRVVANAARTTPKLYECEPMSLLGAMMTAAALGIEPNTPQGFAWLIPFKNTKKGITEAQLIIGYKGFIDLAFRSGVLTYIDAGVHYADDDMWQYEKGMNFTLRHAEGPQAGEKLHAYAIAKWQNPNGGEGTAAVVLPWSKVMKVRDDSQNWKTAKRYNKTGQSPWSTHEDVMAMKTAIRALAQSGRLPMSVELQTAINLDGQPADFRRVVETGDPFPVAGATEEDAPVEGDIIDGEVQEEESSQEEEPPKEEPPKTTPRSRKKTEPKPKTDEKAATEKFAKARKISDTVMADLLDGGPDHYEAILAQHKKDMDWLLKAEPKLHADVMSVMEE